MNKNVKLYYSLLKNFKNKTRATELSPPMKANAASLKTLWRKLNYCGLINASMLILSKVCTIWIWTFKQLFMNLGNEDDYIVISLVRTREIGFLKNLRRTNVMLTRCKKGMFIISNKQFLLGAGSETLVATLLAKAGNPWLAIADIENDNFWLPWSFSHLKL